MKYYYKINRSKLLFLIYLLITSLGITILASCGGSETKTEFTVVKNSTFPAAVDKGMAEKGKKIFTEKCMSCHKYDQKFVGPALGEVTKRRTSDYILSQILYPDVMIKSNDTVKVLLQKHLTPMPNQHLKMDEAKCVYEHLRDVAAGGNK